MSLKRALKWSALGLAAVLVLGLLAGTWFVRQRQPQRPHSA